MAKKKMTLEEKLEEAIVKDAPYEVPDNWIWSNVGSISLEIKNGTTIKQNKDEIGIKVTRIESLQNNGIDLNRLGTIIETEKIKEQDYYIDGDIALSHINSLEHVGKTALIDNSLLPLVHGMNLLRIRVNKRIILPKYFQLYTRGYDYKKFVVDRVNRAVNQVSLNQKNLSDVPIPIPPLKEQQRIVDKIESLFEKLDKAKELIEEVRDDFEKRKTAILEKAFRGELTKEWRIKNRTDRCYDVLMHEIKNRNEIYSKVNKKNKPNFMNYGENDILIDKNLPGNWIKCPVGLICDCIVPGRDKPKSFTGDIPWITIPNVISDYINTNSSELKLSDAEIQEVNAKVIPIKSVIMSCVGRFGISAIVDKSCVINQQLHAFLPYEKLINPKFLMYHIRILRTYMESIATSTTIAYVNKSGCNSLPINLPPIEEQKEIVRILDKLLEEESKIEELTVLEEQIELIKKSILAKAFRGQLGTNCEDDENALELLKEILNKE